MLKLVSVATVALVLPFCQLVSPAHLYKTNILLHQNLREPHIIILTTLTREVYHICAIKAVTKVVIPQNQLHSMTVAITLKMTDFTKAFQHGVHGIVYNCMHGLYM